MKKLLIIAGILLLTGSSSLAIDDAVKLSGKDLITFSQNEMDPILGLTEKQLWLVETIRYVTTHEE